MRVLIVEDEKKVAAAIRRGLEAEGFAADVALTGTDGLWMASENPYDVIVLDIMLPGMNGYEVAMRKDHFACFHPDPFRSCKSSRGKAFYVRGGNPYVKVKTYS